MKTAQQLACSHVQRTERAQLWKEGGVYHVRGEGVWKVFHRLLEARAFFKEAA